MAISQSITKKFTPNYKNVNYLSKNFSEFRQNLIEFAKSYYPQTYTDFNEASPGMMFIEMAAYVGDVMSFYIDNQFKENLLVYAKERKNVISIAQAFGYKPRLAAPAVVTAIVYQVVPALGPTENYDPDGRFFLKIQENSQFSSNTPPSQIFLSTENIDFADSLQRDIRVFSRDAVSKVPTAYIASKPINLISANTKTATFSFGSPQKFSRVELQDTNVISIVSVVDLDGNEWSEVDFLGQDVVLEERDVSARTSAGYLESGSLDITLPPTKLAVYRKKPRRFTTRVNTNLKMEMWFGSGIGNIDESLVFLNSTDIANNKYRQLVGNTTLNPTDFLESDAFGVAPANTTLTVTYLIGGGTESNVSSNTITNVENVNVANRAEDYPSSDRALFGQVVSSVAINNEEPATGGGSVETIEEIRQNALAFFNGQNRVVTDKDYLVRTYAMPPKFGTVAKAFVIRDEQINALATQNEADLIVNVDEDPFNNRRYVQDPVSPNATNIYVLGYNASEKLTTLNTLVKKNLATYLEQFRVLTDDVNILDAFVVNVAVQFNIVVYRHYNMNDVLARCIDAVKDFFDIQKWQINQPIIMNDLRLTIGSVEGVQTVTNVNITNKYFFKDGRDYQEYRYPISEATVDDIIYPSLDPCIFELRYPDTDIVGNARQ
jgi:hypothetical protein